MTCALGLQEDWAMYMITKKRSIKLNMTEFDTEFADEHAAGSQVCSACVLSLMCSALVLSFTVVIITDSKAVFQPLLGFAAVLWSPFTFHGRPESQFLADECQQTVFCQGPRL